MPQGIDVITSTPSATPNTGNKHMKQIQINMTLSVKEAVALHHWLNGGDRCHQAYAEAYKEHYAQPEITSLLADSENVYTAFKAVSTALGQAQISPANPEHWQDLRVGDYTAKIVDGGAVVKVGCQIIPFSQVAALYEEMKKQQIQQKI